MSDSRPPVQVRGLRRVVYVVLAFLFLGLGLLGVVLPGLPTTPFLLLTSYFLLRSSPRLHDRVVQMPVVGRPLRDWEENRGIRFRVKLFATVMIAAVVALSLFSQDLNTPTKTVIVFLAATGMTVIWRLPTIRE